MEAPVPIPSDPADEIEREVDQAIALCDGDLRATIRAALVYNTFLERKLDMMRGMISSGFTRGRISPERKASEKTDDWREVSSGEAEKAESAPLVQK